MNQSPELLAATNLDFVEPLYAQYLRDPSIVAAPWRQYFAAFAADPPPSPPPRLGPSFHPPRLFDAAPTLPRDAGEGAAERLQRLQHRVDDLVRAYRVRGHIAAHVDPISDLKPVVPELDPQFYGFTGEDLNRPFVCETLNVEGRLTLREIIDRLQRIYCGAIGTQYMHIDDLQVRRWFQERIETLPQRSALTRELQLRILTRLTDAVVFEQFIRKKFVGAKSFSLEGGESLIPLLDLAIEKASQLGGQEIVIGMAHRGRLNVLANLMGKSPREIFREFEDKDPDLYLGGGDVKYHLGNSTDFVTSAGRHVHLSLCFNPSHLEFVNPVVLGRVRAKQDRRGDTQHEQVLPFLIHGDAAFIGEGVVQETLNLSRLPAYRVGGTIHVIVNNQIGFTTPPRESRSTMYCTSVAKMLPAPIFHVNGEDPEAVARCIELALEFRHRFKLDVVIDMYCYRRLGHNEGDEPSFTQPVLYRLIEKRPSVRDGYLQHLLQLGGISREEADQIAADRHQRLEQALSEARGEYCALPPSSLAGVWSGYGGGPEPADDTPATGVATDRLTEWLERLIEVPSGFRLHPKLQRLFEQRREMVRGERPLDWAAAETLALVSLATEGHRIRLTGQDSERGTFSHRHAVLHDYDNGRVWRPLTELVAPHAPLEICNSPLSETGVLGFEYGYSLDYPEALVLWEAQFGDFANAAQVIIDQFIISGEDKWRRLSGLVLLLPHGFEGMGPEHSSARLERFLALAADDNIQVAVPTTPAQYFHLLRRQLRRRWRKPLVVLTPKSMLRHPRVVSSFRELAQGAFERVLPDAGGVDLGAARRVLLCGGKLYYELAARRQELEATDVALLRLEQLHPFPRAQLEGLLNHCRDGTNVIWVQDEPENMGAWRYLRVTVGMQFLGRLPFTGICRPASASPATGSHAAHHLEQEDILTRAFSAELPQPRPRTETITSVKHLTQA